MSDENVQAGATGSANPTPKRKLGVSKEVVGGSIVPLPVPYKLERPTEQYATGYNFPMAKLVAVTFIPQKETKAGPKDVLSFIFKDDKQRQYNHLEFPIDESDAKFEDKLEWLQQRLKHIWDESIGEASFPAEGLGADAETFAQLYEAVAKSFNSVKTGEGELATTVFNKNPMYIKLVYNRDRAQLPLFPNFLQRAVQGGKIIPVISLNITNRDKVTISEAPSGGASFGGGSFSGEVSQGFATNDFPDV